MGIYIKGVNKPKECKYCRFTHIYEHPEAGDYEICQFIDEPIPAGIDNRCPLIEVSTPHGRLIDVDALDTGRDYSIGDEEEMANDLSEAIYNAPTIIESEANDDKKRSGK